MRIHKRSHKLRTAQRSHTAQPLLFMINISHRAGLGRKWVWLVNSVAIDLCKSFSGKHWPTIFPMTPSVHDLIAQSWPCRWLRCKVAHTWTQTTHKYIQFWRSRATWPGWPDHLLWTWLAGMLPRLYVVYDVMARGARQQTLAKVMHNRHPPPPPHPT